MNCLCWDALTPWISQREAVVQRAPLLERIRWPHHFDACDGRGRSWFWDDWPIFPTNWEPKLAPKKNEWDKVRKYKHHLANNYASLTFANMSSAQALWSGVLWYDKFLNMISSSLDLSRYDSVGWNQGLIIETYWNQTSTPQVPPPGVLESKFLPQEAHSQLRGCDAKAPGSMRRMAFKWDSGTCKENLTVLAKTGKL